MADYKFIAGLDDREFRAGVRRLDAEVKGVGRGFGRSFDEANSGMGRLNASTLLVGRSLGRLVGLSSGIMALTAGFRVLALEGREIGRGMHESSDAIDGLRSTWGQFVREQAGGLREVGGRLDQLGAIPIAFAERSMKTGMRMLDLITAGRDTLLSGGSFADAEREARERRIELDRQASLHRDLQEQRKLQPFQRPIIDEIAGLEARGAGDTVGEARIRERSYNAERRRRLEEQLDKAKITGSSRRTILDMESRRATLSESDVVGEAQRDLDNRHAKLRETFGRLGIEASRRSTNEVDSALLLNALDYGERIREVRGDRSLPEQVRREAVSELERLRGASAFGIMDRAREKHLRSGDWRTLGSGMTADAFTAAQVLGADAAPRMVATVGAASANEQAAAEEARKQTKALEESKRLLESIDEGIRKGPVAVFQ